MAANLLLAKERGLSQEEIEKINALHLQIDAIISANVHRKFNEEVKEDIHRIEINLQKLWHFNQDRAYHTSAPLYEFKCKWVGRKFRCNITGKELTLEHEMVYPKAYIQIGESALDLGDLYYNRVIGSLEEICVECGNSVNDLHKLDCNQQWKEE